MSMDIDETLPVADPPLGEALEYLTQYFPFWYRDTYMVPASFEFTIEEPEHSENMRGQKLDEQRRGDAGEQIIFKLFESFGKDNDEPMFVISKYTFSKYWGSSDSKRNGEHDFLIIHKNFGVVLMQVKNIKSSVSEHGRKKRISQAKVQLDEDRKMLQIYHEIDVPVQRAFVVLPSTRAGTSLPCNTSNGYQILYEEDFHSIEAFRNTFQSKIFNVASINPLLCDKYQYTVALYAYTAECSSMMASIKRSKDKIENRTNLLLTAAMSTETNFEKFDKKKKKIALPNVFTKEQLNVLKQNPPMLYVEGVAGSGKTQLLLTKVKMVIRAWWERNREACRNREYTLYEPILVLCYNRQLRKVLEDELHSYCLELIQENLEIPAREKIVRVRNQDKLLYECAGLTDHSHKLDFMQTCLDNDKYCRSLISKVGKFKHLFLDEGQDFYGPWLAFFSLFWLLGANKNYFWVFFDNNQLGHLGGNSVPDGIPKEFQILSLTKVMRNTKNIYDSYCDLCKLSSTIKLGHHIIGLEVFWFSSNDLVSQLKQCLKYLLDHRINAGDICVLVKDSNCVNEIISYVRWENGYNVRDGYNWLCCSADDRKNFVTIESIMKFKGQERQVVILYDPYFPYTCRREKLIYTAMSRTISLLYVIERSETNLQWEENVNSNT